MTLTGDIHTGAHTGTVPTHDRMRSRGGMAQRSMMLHRGIAGIVFAGSLTLYAATGHPGIAGWDSTELMAAARSGGVPHPPGAMPYLLPASWFAALPLPMEPARRLMLFSALTSALTVTVAYLVAVRVLAALPHASGRSGDDAPVLAGAAVGALVLAACESFWANATVFETHNPELLLNAVALLLALGAADEHTPSAGRAVAAPVSALALGAATAMGDLWMCTLAPLVMIAVLGGGHAAGRAVPSVQESRARRRRITAAMLLACVCAVLAAGAIPRGIGALPMLLMHPVVTSPAGALLAGAVATAAVLGLAGAVLARRARTARAGAWGAVAACFCLGLSVHALVPARAASHPVVNHADPSTVSRAAAYLSAPGPAQGASWRVRRWRDDAASLEQYASYGSAWEYTLAWQLQHGFARYVFWNTVGRESDQPGAAPVFIAPAAARADLRVAEVPAAYPVRWFALPLALGIAGAAWSLRRSLRTGALLLLLLVMYGPVYAFLLNLSGPFPHEHDGMFAGACFAFSLLIAAGAHAVLHRASRREGPRMHLRMAPAALVLLALPAWMGASAYTAHDRSGDTTLRSIAAGMLASCDSNAVLITAGDNDTYGAQCLQVFEGLRSDVRVVCASGDRAATDSIVAACGQDIPVHFSAACDPDDTDAYDDNLRLEGLTWRLVQKRATRIQRVNTDVTARVLGIPGAQPRTVQPRTALTRTAQAGVMPPLPAGPMHADPLARAAARLVRDAHMRLAEQQLRTGAGGARAARTLDAMEAAVPPRVYPFDAGDAFEAALLMRDAGADASARRMFARIERVCTAAMEGAGGLDRSVHSPARILLELYRAQRRTRDAEALLARLERRYPHAADVRAARTNIDSFMQTDSSISTNTR